MTSAARRALTVMALCATSLSTHALSGGPLSGRVVDDATGEPVRDALVVVYWNGSWTRFFDESSSACYRVETARTDANGRYEIAAWRRPWKIEDLRFSSAGPTYNVFKPGYRVSARTPPSPDVLLITRFVGSKDAYIKTVLGSPAWACDRAGEHGELVNTDPRDSFKPEEVPQ